MMPPLPPPMLEHVELGGSVVGAVIADVWVSLLATRVDTEIFNRGKDVSN